MSCVDNRYNGVLLTLVDSNCGLCEAAFYRKEAKLPTLRDNVTIHKLVANIRLNDDAMHALLDMSPNKRVWIDANRLSMPPSLTSEMLEMLFSPPVLKQFINIVCHPESIDTNEYIFNKRQSLLSSCISREEVLESLSRFRSAILAVRVAILCATTSTITSNNSITNDVYDNKDVEHALNVFYICAKALEPIVSNIINNDTTAPTSQYISKLWYRVNLEENKGHVSNDELGKLKTIILDSLNKTDAVRPEMKCQGTITMLMPLWCLAHIFQCKIVEDKCMYLMHTRYNEVEACVHSLKSRYIDSLWDMYRGRIQAFDKNIYTVSAPMASVVSDDGRVEQSDDVCIVDANHISDGSTSIIHETHCDTDNQSAGVINDVTSIMKERNETMKKEGDRVELYLQSAREVLHHQEDRLQHTINTYTSVKSRSKNMTLDEIAHEEVTISNYNPTPHSLHKGDTYTNKTAIYDIVNSVSQHNENHVNINNEVGNVCVTSTTNDSFYTSTLTPSSVNDVQDKLIRDLVNRAKEGDAEAGVILAEVRCTQAAATERERKRIAEEERKQEKFRVKENLQIFLKRQKEIRHTLAKSSHYKHVINSNAVHDTGNDLNDRWSREHRNKGTVDVKEAQRRARLRVIHRSQYYKSLIHDNVLERQKKRERIFKDRDNRLRAFQRKAITHHMNNYNKYQSKPLNVNRVDVYGYDDTVVVKSKTNKVQDSKASLESKAKNKSKAILFSPTRKERYYTIPEDPTVTFVVST